MSIAIAVSAISMIVAYRISVDLGRSSELRSLENEAETLLSQLGKTKDLVDADLLIDSLGEVSSRRTSFNPVLIKLRIGERYYFRPEIKLETLTQIESSEAFSANGSGFVVINDNDYMWVQRGQSGGDIEITLASNPFFLDEALGYIATRLTVTAFLTFWIAVWSALFISTLIVKRIEKNNEAITFLAMHDSLTQLPNRVQLLEHVERYTKSQSTDKPGSNQSPAILMVVDLDRFKEVNDTLGHAVGDDVLVALSDRIRSELDSSIFLARIGGDEFVVWAEDTEAIEALNVADRIIQCCRQPVEINGSFIGLGASIGIANFPEHGSDVETLMKSADIAMYQAKVNRQGIKIYDEDDNTHTVFKMKLANNLNTALEERQFVLHYQVKVRLDTQKIVGVEALTRWQHPELGLIQPVSFIHLIEQRGLINQFSKYVIETAVSQIRDWMDEDLSVNIAVNISPFNLADPTFIEYIQSTLDNYNVPAEMLEIELTETASMMDIETTRKVFGELKKVGVKLSIDDYGTGMSSLAYLKELEVDFIKIDRSFISNMLIDSRDQAIVRSTIDLINHLGRRVVAEGIETAELVTELRDMNCSFGQGFYFSRPVSEEMLKPILLGGINSDWQKKAGG